MGSTAMWTGDQHPTLRSPWSGRGRGRKRLYRGLAEPSHPQSLGRRDHHCGGKWRQGFGGDNGPAIDAQLNNPLDVAVDSAGNLYIADTLNRRIRKVSNGVITTVAGKSLTSDPVSTMIRVASAAMGARPPAHS